MSSRQLYVFVEGDDDKRLFDQVVRKKLELAFRPIHIVKYAEMANRKVNGFLETAYESQSRVIFAADIDKSDNSEACSSRCRSSYSELHREDVVCVIREIEGWYLAGLDGQLLRICAPRVPASTDTVGKGQFESLVPKRYGGSVLAFKEAILECFSIRAARQRNSSFRAFADAWDITA